MNETTLIIGILGVGKSTLARNAVSKYEKAVVITNFAKDFEGECKIINKSALLSEFDKTCLVSDDDVENEIAMRYAYEIGKRLLVVDEAHIYSENEQLKKMVRYSRQHDLDVILLSHSFFDFARLNRHLIHNIIVMKMTDDEGRGDPYELSYIDRISPGNEIRKLKKYEFQIIKGTIPKWLNKKDLTFNENILILKM